MFRRYAFILCLLAVPAFAQTAQTGRKTVDLPTSKQILEPVPGQPQQINSFPANLAVSPDGRYVAILNAGYGTKISKFGQSIAILDRTENKVTDYADPRVGRQSKQVYFYGIAFSSDGSKVYASIGSITDPQGADKGNTGNGIAVYALNNGTLEPEKFIPIAMRELKPPYTLARGLITARAARKLADNLAPAFPAGIAVIKGDSGDQLFVANNLSDDTVLLDVATGKELSRITPNPHHRVPSTYPMAVAVSADGKRGWVSEWNYGGVTALDLVNGKRITPGGIFFKGAPSSHPAAILLSPDGKRLAIAHANRDAVEIADVNGADGMRQVALIDVRLPGQEYPGIYPIGLAQSADGKRLYVALGSADAVAVVDTTPLLKLDPNAKGPLNLKPMGFIPTGWYPTSLAVIGDELVVATAKGNGTGPNSENAPDVGSGFNPRPGHPYIFSILGGSVARMNTSKIEGDLKRLTAEVLESNRMSGRLPELAFKGGKNPIKHVIYVIRENRTYDQVFGDIKEANGDPSLVMYGEEITPNAHKLARQFGVIDNFYDSGEVSGDGHVWSTAAIGSDYTERIIQINYRGRERTYDFEGTNAEENPYVQNSNDVNEPGTGYIWGNVARHGLTHRNYAEYVKMEFCDSPTLVSPHQENEPVAVCPAKFIDKGEPLPGNGGASPYPWHVPVIAPNPQPTKTEIAGHFNPNYATFNTSYPDQLRMDEFLREFDGFVKARESGQGPNQQLPNFIVMKLPNDHTGGTRPGVPTPQANVADNDIALGRLVEAVSHSPYWDDTAILVLEDDAQNGADHVDAHRSLALVISKYSPVTTPDKPFVDHHFYTTVNMIHTAEALLGLPPMNNNDARAAVMAPLFTGPGTQPPFTVDKKNLDNGLIYKVNPQNAPGARQSSKMDFSHPDAAPADELNAILWRQAKGNVPMPAPKHNVIPED